MTILGTDTAPLGRASSLVGHRSSVIGRRSSCGQGLWVAESAEEGLSNTRAEASERGSSLESQPAHPSGPRRPRPMTTSSSKVTATSGNSNDRFGLRRESQNSPLKHHLLPRLLEWGLNVVIMPGGGDSVSEQSVRIPQRLLNAGWFTMALLILLSTAAGTRLVAFYLG